MKALPMSVRAQAPPPLPLILVRQPFSPLLVPPCVECGRISGRRKFPREMPSKGPGFAAEARPLPLVVIDPRSVAAERRCHLRSLGGVGFRRFPPVGIPVIG